MSAERSAAPFVAAVDLGTGPTPHLLDVRWRLDQPDGRADFAARHIPGSVYVDLDTVLAAPPGPGDGRHPLPELDTFRMWLAGHGIGPDSRVVVLDDWNGLAAGRAWWMLRWAGVADASILDGGLAAWIAAGGTVVAGVDDAASVTPLDRSLFVGGPSMPTIDADEAAAVPAAGGVLVDARIAARYTGDEEPMDPRPGHIPGARNVAVADLTDDSGRLVADVADQFAAVGVGGGGDVAVYCGSGVTACFEVAVLETLGIAASLYPGSWSQWSSQPQRPVATGTAAG